MRERESKISFRGQEIYVGIDIHLEGWSVTVLSETFVLKKFSQHPSPEALYGFSARSYPGVKYRSVYEAGFCGFWIHERLTALGIDNIVVSPADVPTKNSEKLRKTDTVDNGKLARSLRANELKGIYTPDSVSLEIRSLIKLKNPVAKGTARQKNRLKSQLWYLDIETPQEFLTPFSNWSKHFLAWLKEVETLIPNGRQALDIHIRHLEELRYQKLEMTRALRTLTKTDRFREPLRLITGVPGFGQATGMAFLPEIYNITHFRNAEQLAACIGMIPMYHSNGEKGGTEDITIRKHAIICYNLIKAAWVAVRQDPAMNLFRTEQHKRMPRGKTIVKVARKLVNRLFFVLERQTEYVNNIVLQRNPSDERIFPERTLHSYRGVNVRLK